MNSKNSSVSRSRSSAGEPGPTAVTPSRMADCQRRSRASRLVIASYHWSLWTRYRSRREPGSRSRETRCVCER
jgi:hypothetical protein